LGVHSEAGLNRKFMEFIKLLNIYLNHFPNHEKFALSNRIRNTAYEIYDLIAEGEKSKSGIGRPLYLCSVTPKIQIQFHTW
jgi:hypothetical protein